MAREVWSARFYVNANVNHIEELDPVLRMAAQALERGKRRKREPASRPRELLKYVHGVWGILR